MEDGQERVLRFFFSLRTEAIARTGGRDPRVELGSRFTDSRSGDH